MSVFSEKRVILLFAVVLIFGILAVKPGIREGIDLKGGSRLVLGFEASLVYVDLHAGTELIQVQDILQKNIGASIRALAYDENRQEAVFEIGRIVDQTTVENALENLGTVVKVEEKLGPNTLDEVMYALHSRVDPTGTLGVNFQPVGDNMVIFEIAGIDPKRAEELLGRPGHLEIFIGDNLVLAGEDIGSVGSVGFDVMNRDWYVPFDIASEEGRQRWKELSTGKTGYLTGIYLDRPSDAVLIFRDFETSDIVYENTHRLYLSSLSNQPTEGVIFYLQVTAVRIPEDNIIPPEVREFLVQQSATKRRAIILGPRDTFTEEVLSEIENLGFSIENNQKAESQTYLEWITSVSGLESWPVISSEVAGAEISGLRITTGNSDTSRREAEDLKAILSQKLPVKVTIESKASVDPKLGEEFTKQALMVVAISVAGVGAMIYGRYRHPKISLAIMGIMVCELIITIGMASAFRWTIGLPEIGGLLAVIGTGVDQQIIITDELMRGERVRKALGGRMRRAFSVIFASVATTMAAMTALAILGFGVFRGFAIITIAGLLVAVLVTRPAYARIASAIIGKES